MMQCKFCQRDGSDNERTFGPRRFPKTGSPGEPLAPPKDATAQTDRIAERCGVILPKSLPDLH
jgi:hypothetical protein